MEVLSILIRKGEEVQITHLHFEDDTLAFYKDSREQVAYLSWILVRFEDISGLKINLEKNSIMSVGNVENLKDLALS